MRTLFRNGKIVNVFNDSLHQADVLLENEKIIGVGEYATEKADMIVEAEGKIICPGFIDGHIHIESTMLRPSEFARACLPHGTTMVIADPHEITNVAGTEGVQFMLAATENLPLQNCFMMPSCIPATPLDENGAKMETKDIAPFYSHPRVLGLGEVMDYPGVISREKGIMDKIRYTLSAGLPVNGHAPMLSGKDLDRYIAAGIQDDHECSTAEEAKERIMKGQWIMIRQGTAARNLEALMPLFEEPFSRRCLLVTDDKHPADLLKYGHIDSIIRQAVSMGAPVLTAIRMASLQAAQRYGMTHKGAIAPGYDADLLVLDDLPTLKIRDVYCHGNPAVDNGRIVHFDAPSIPDPLWKRVRNSFHLDRVNPQDLMLHPTGSRCRMIRLIHGQLITREDIVPMDFTRRNGIDPDRDILKLAVIERHHRTGHMGIGFITGLGLRRGAIASSVSHDDHNLIVAGASEEDMALAANTVREMAGGLAVVCDARITACLPLPIGGLMSMTSAEDTARANEAVRLAAGDLMEKPGPDPFMALSFVSLPVIPDLKMTTRGLVDVNTQTLVPLFV